jgi:hypothetical protein
LEWGNFRRCRFIIALLKSQVVFGDTALVGAHEFLDIGAIGLDRLRTGENNALLPFRKIA